ncbi:DUF6081 family protein [Kitasatospora brasiliensis]|uniref:DUF6081 family protein n=1 Tax=Kitasatospora brasiliensis TaxID=3058040 RepID=UPI00293117D8|nr:DUF6081 family protein [Kitasatospora sp. K002]
MPRAQTHSDPAAVDGGRVVWDDFRDGFDHRGDGSRWTLTPCGDALPDGDGVVTTTEAGLRVVPTGTNPRTGEPAFVFTTGRESEGGGGGADHLKFFALARHTSKAGILGFDAEPGRVLTIDVTMSARTFGTERHPFGAAAADPASLPQNRLWGQGTRLDVREMGVTSASR